MFQTPQDFDSSKELGCSLERVLLHNFRFQGIPCGLNPGTTLDEKQKYDIILELPGRRILLESKLDLGSGVTGNMCIEEDTLNHTQADYFLHALVNVRVFDRNEYRNLFNSVLPKMGGDNKQMKLALIRNPFYMGTPLWKFTRDLK